MENMTEDDAAAAVAASVPEELMAASQQQQQRHLHHHLTDEEGHHHHHHHHLHHHHLQHHHHHHLGVADDAVVLEPHVGGNPAASKGVEDDDLDQIRLVDQQEEQNLLASVVGGSGVSGGSVFLRRPIKTEDEDLMATSRVHQLELADDDGAAPAPAPDPGSSTAAEGPPVPEPAPSPLPPTAPGPGKRRGTATTTTTNRSSKALTSKGASSSGNGNQQEAAAAAAALVGGDFVSFHDQIQSVDPMLLWSMVRARVVPLVSVWDFLCDKGKMTDIYPFSVDLVRRPGDPDFPELPSGSRHSAKLQAYKLQVIMRKKNLRNTYHIGGLIDSHGTFCIMSVVVPSGDAGSTEGGLGRDDPFDGLLL